MQQWRKHLAEKIGAEGLPEAVIQTALDGGATISPALWYRAQAVWRDPAEAVMAATSERLVPLWSCGTTHAFAGQGRFLIWSPETDEPDGVLASFAELVRGLLTDLYEDEEDDDERSRIARLFLPADEVAEALIPEPR